VIALLKQTYTACNQIKQYDTWSVKASECVAKTYNFENAKYWYTLFKGQTGTKDNLDYHIGGSRVFNYSDAMQYYGITDGNNRYRSVYNQISTYLKDLNPGGFNETCKDGVVGYEDAVNLYFLKSISDVDAGTADKQDYTKEKTETMAQGNWDIKFATNSTAINGSEKDLEEIYYLLIEAEQTKLKIIGFTDNVGNPESNITLSRGRANSVVSYLTSKGVPTDRFQLIDGYGAEQPIADNKTSEGRAKNRRVQITLLK
jgi:outer membrane protein OmpA-like peptidoglycan-associated protein